MRDPNLKFFKEYKTIKVDYDYHKKLYEYVKSGKKILLEGAQGCDLSLDQYKHYPHVTSRDVSVSEMLKDSKISPCRLKDVIMVIRPFPIRISNEIYDGSYLYSGPYGDENIELSWDQINVGAHIRQYPTAVDEDDIKEYLGESFDFTETTTVTQKTRRVFDIDLNLLRENIENNESPNFEIYLNFFEQLDDSNRNVSGIYTGCGDSIYFDKYIREYLAWLEDELKVPITMLGTGPDLTHYIDRRPYLKSLKK